VRYFTHSNPDRVQIMSDTNTEWFRCRIDKQRLKELSQRNDRTPLLWFGSYILLVIASASAVVLSWNTPSVWVWLAVYGALWGLAPSAVHETCHHTPFRRRWLNKATLWLFGWMVQMEPQSVRWGHTGHHSHTHFEHGDTVQCRPRLLGRVVLLEVANLAGLRLDHAGNARGHPRRRHCESDP
jgi:fatty acid desaturase